MGRHNMCVRVEEQERERERPDSINTFSKKSHTFPATRENKPRGFSLIFNIEVLYNFFFFFDSFVCLLKSEAMRATKKQNLKRKNEKFGEVGVGGAFSSVPSCLSIIIIITIVIIDGVPVV